MTTANVMESNNNRPLGIPPAQSALLRIEQDGGLGVCDAETGFWWMEARRRFLEGLGFGLEMGRGMYQVECSHFLPLPPRPCLPQGQNRRQKQEESKGQPRN